jgi:hypothetical protein
MVLFTNEPPRGELRGIKPCRFRIALKVIRVIRAICEICGLKNNGSMEVNHERG